MPAIYGEEVRLYSGTLGGEKHYWWPGSYKEQGQPSWSQQVELLQKRWTSRNRGFTGEVGESSGDEDEKAADNNTWGESFAKENDAKDNAKEDFGQAD